MNNVIEQLITEVIDVNKKIIKTFEDNKQLKDTYRGYQIFLSPLFFNPNVMFIGINPGDGFFTEYGKLLERYKPFEKQDTKNDLWTLLQYCLNKTGKKEYLDDIVLLNYYFFSTSNLNKLHLFFNILPKELRKEVLEKSDQWIKTLITEISPKYIICGGSYTLGKLKRLFKYSSLEPEHNKNNFVGKLDNTIVFTYKRRYSNMRNREEFITYLKKYLLENKE